MAEYDIVVIGSGPGGYVCAIKAAQLGMKVACVEKSPGGLGGTCLNVGCIPSKALLHASAKYEYACAHASDIGVECDNVRLNLEKMMSHKNKVVKELTGGIGFLFKKNKITLLEGIGRLAGNSQVTVTNAQGDSQTVTARHIVVATGSVVTELSGVVVDERKVVSSTGALSLTEVPKNMAVIGAGYIGLELGSVWSRLGAEVIVIEYADRIATGMDSEIARQFQKTLEKQGLKFLLTQKVEKIDNQEGKSPIIHIEDRANGQKQALPFDVVLVSAGRKPCTDGLGLDQVGVKTDERGRISVNASLETSVKGVYAIGDVIAGPMLAHKAEEEGVALAEMLAGQAGHVNYEVIPGVIYTDPEVASVGKTEEELKAASIPYNVGKFSFAANGRAKACQAETGIVKILSHKETDRLLGCHIMGADAGNMIVEAVAVMEFKGSAEDLARVIHPHPSLSEAVKEAAIAASSGKALHS